MLDAMNDNSPHEKTLFRVMVIGTCVSFGMLGAIAASMKDFIHGNAAFEFSIRTFVGFLIGFAVGWVFWKVLRTKLPR
jgi:NhaP-type Na+/H+ or K+/H+ antiporter